MVDPSLTNHDLKTPDFKVSTRYFDVEKASEWGRLGECDDYFWKTPKELINDTTPQQTEKKENASSEESKVSDASDESVFKDRDWSRMDSLACYKQKPETTQRLAGGQETKKKCAETDNLFDR
jgi:hypothetical protein